MHLLEILVWYNVIHLNTVYGYLKCGVLEHNRSYGSIGPVETSIRPDKDSLYCTYKINAKRGDPTRSTVLKWKKFDIQSRMPECYSNFVLVYTGCGLVKKKVAKFCSLNADKPFPIYSHDGCIEIVFRLSSQFDGLGGKFRADYNTDYNTVFTGIDVCPDNQLNSLSGVLSTPRWPEPYRRRAGYYHTLTCKWDMDNTQRKNMLVVIMDTDFAKKRYPVESRKDVLKLDYYDAKLFKRRSKKRYGNTASNEFEKFYTSSTFEISFKAFFNPYLDLKKNRGFLVGYMAYGDRVAITTTTTTTTTTESWDYNNSNFDDDDDDEKMSTFTIAVIIIVALSFIVGCFCCCVKQVGQSGSHEENNLDDEAIDRPEDIMNRLIPLNASPRFVGHVRHEHPERNDSNNNSDSSDQNQANALGRDSSYRENQTNGSLPNVELTDEAPPAYNPNLHLSYPTAPSSQTNEEAPPPTYEEVLQGIYGDSML